MKTFEKLESLGFFDWLSKTHSLRDTDMKPEYLDELPLNDIHRTVANSMVFRWFREKHNIDGLLHKTAEGSYYFWITECEYENYNHYKYYNQMVYFNTYEEAELACLENLIELVESKSE